jgi:hypothetical protein
MNSAAMRSVETAPELNTGVHTVTLPTGKLSLNVNHSELPLLELCDFAARINKRRGFLFVSNVLAREKPCKPAEMLRVHSNLADRLPADLPGPVVFIGMAEYAISLGQSIFELYQERTGRDDCLYIHSTRLNLGRERFASFAEEHSHAPAHIVYNPERDVDLELMRSARTLVLVDDEATTGRTFLNLAKGFAEKCPLLEQVATIVITDWRGDEQRQLIIDAMPVPCISLAILDGEYQFVPDPNSPEMVMPSVIGDGRCIDDSIRGNHGRFGLRKRAGAHLGVVDNLDVHPGEKCLLLGTGEFIHVPFLLGCELEKRGVDARVQSTTRNPLMSWGAIETTLTHRDCVNGIVSFAYNVHQHYDRVFICTEFSQDQIDPALVEQLNAEIIVF